MNANFEGANLAPRTTYNKLFENMAYIVNPTATGYIADGVDLGVKLMRYQTIFVYDTEVRGDDLFVSYYLVTSFHDANLEGVNFANANLQQVIFVNANLSNADLSGSDLRGSVLLNADLSGANLNGALLDGAVLSCKNHTICD